MKLMLMECIRGDDTILGKREYFIKLESDAELRVYEEGSIPKSPDDYWRGYANGEMRALILAFLDDELGDSDVYYYLLPCEDTPKIGEVYDELDDELWKRVR